MGIESRVIRYPPSAFAKNQFSHEVSSYKSYYNMDMQQRLSANHEQKQTIAIALEAGNNPNYNVVLLGGSVNAKHQFIYGDDASAQLGKYHADKLILSVDGISPEGGLTTFYNQEVELDRIMLSHSATRIIAADCTKLGRTAFAQIATLDEADYIITNTEATGQENFDELKQFVPNVITV